MMEASFTQDLSAAASRILEILGTELFNFGGIPVSLSKLVIAVLLLVAGYGVAKALSQLLERVLERRFSFEAGSAYAFRALAFYILLASFALVSLRTVNIPLTAFTVLGGALAIGVGFGSQNVVNNFISGLILLAERPIKVGDMVEVDGTFGQIERIGPRSTRVRTTDNAHIIVPNSTFLEKNVLNWTLSDDLVRTHVAVGVVYGSPTREVERLFMKVMKEHERILKSPEPIVLFTDFGDNSLNFQGFFWIKMRQFMERRRIQSEVRYRIDDLFREAGIVIAFPQRDVHLDTARPLQIRVVPAGPEREAPS